MMTKPITGTIDPIFHYCLLGIFLFTSVSFFFLFVINWETWFFGIKLDGFPAGILLFIKFLIPAILSFIIVRYPEKIMVIAMVSLVFFGIFFIDSSVTIQKNTSGKEFFGIIPVLLVLIPAIILISGFLVNRRWHRDGDSVQNARITDPDFPMIVAQKQGRYSTGDTLMFALAGVVFAVIVGPVILSLLFSTMNAGVAPSGNPVDSLLTKVDENGTTEWQTLVHGYSDSPLIVSRSGNGDFIIGGMFRSSVHTDASLNVMKLGPEGNPVWNFQRGVFAYPETNLGALHAVLPTAGEYTVIMADGFVIRLDASGNELWHHRYPDVIVHSSSSLPDGGYLMAGDAHEGKPSEPGWMSFDGWILVADRQGDIRWETKETEFTNCQRAVLSSEGNVLVSCSVSDPDPGKSGNRLVALDLQGNYLWKKTFVEKTDGIIYSIRSPGNGTIEVYLRGEGEKKVVLDRKGVVVEEMLLPQKPNSFSHEFVPDISYDTEPHTGNKTRISVRELSGSGTVFSIDFPLNRDGLSRIYSVNPTSDGGYLVASSA